MKDANWTKLTIEKWTSILKKFGDKPGDIGLERLRNYICGLMMGRDFMETVEDYFERRGFTEFNNWVHEILNGERVV